MKKKLVCFVIYLCLVLLTAVNVNAQLPGIINFQAKIADNSGIPLNGVHTFNFSIIDQAYNLLWPDDNPFTIALQVDNGLYSVRLGDANLGMEPISSSIFDENDETYLRISVDGEQLSDQQILPTGYAFKSEKSDDTHKIAGNPVSETLPSENQVLTWSGSQWEPDDVGGLILPYSFIYSGNDDAFTITSTGTGDLVEFEIDNTNSNGDVLDLANNGSGKCLNIQNNGTGVAVKINNHSESSDALQINNYGNQEAIYVNNSGSNEALVIINSGTNELADLRINNSNNDEEVIFALTNGTGVVGWFEINNSSSSSTALIAATNGSGYAGEFEDDVKIWGTLYGGKSECGQGFTTIDHPLDSYNKILRHSNTCSPEMINIYKGRAKLEKGEIKIQLPDYFDALNHPEGREIFLTSVNGWSPLFLSGEIEDNQFIVKTTKDGDPEQEFSWVIYAVRNDKYAQDNPLIVEQEKGVQNSFKKGELLYQK